MNKLKISFFTKIIFLLVIIAIVTVFIGTYVTNTYTIGRITELEKKYVFRVAKSYAYELDKLLKSIDESFTNIYLYDVYGNVLSHEVIKHLEGEKNYNMLDTAVELITRNNANVIDAALYIYDTNLFVAYTKESVRTALNKINYDKSELQNIIKEYGNKMIAIGPHISDFIIQRTYLAENDSPLVISFIQNIYNSKYSIDLSNPIGFVVMNIRNEDFSNMLNSIDKESIGRYIVKYNSNDEILYDSDPSGLSLDKLSNNNAFVQTYEINGGKATLYAVLNKQDIQEYYVAAFNMILMLFLVALIVLIVTGIILSKYTKKRFNPLVSSMKQLETGNFSKINTKIKGDEIGYLESNFNTMIEKLNEYIKLMYLSELEIKEAQLRILQQQINPHFMYNTLQAIGMSALMNDDEETANMINLLGNIFRWSLDSSIKSVQISEELLYLNMYVELQSYRYDNPINYEVNIDNEIKLYLLPKLLLQPLVENAIAYQKVNDEIKINFINEKDTILIEITNKADEGSKKSIEDAIASTSESKHIGLRNINKRIQMFYNNDKLGIVDVGFNKGLLKLQIRIGKRK